VEAARANFQREAVRGESDSVVTSACSDVLLHGLPSAGRVVLEGCGHVPGCTHPDAFAEVVRRFLTSSGAAPGAACPGAGGCAHAH
jgi:pimeloyl-ACP methyl ester carboxylesterase